MPLFTSIHGNLSSIYCSLRATLLQSSRLHLILTTLSTETHISWINHSLANFDVLSNLPYSSATLTTIFLEPPALLLNTSSALSISLGPTLAATSNSIGFNCPLSRNSSNLGMKPAISLLTSWPCSESVLPMTPSSTLQVSMPLTGSMGLLYSHQLWDSMRIDLGTDQSFVVAKYLGLALGSPC